eukprot:GHVS01066744.1.p1 GENE.GHVS01066744.1~~GHVS01066744.1.p1  ORF type:complete len:234 (+),score=27.85 GHVS01066744.1:405-1106(+)
MEFSKHIGKKNVVLGTMLYRILHLKAFRNIPVILQLLTTYRIHTTLLEKEEFRKLGDIASWAGEQNERRSKWLGGGTIRFADKCDGFATTLQMKATRAEVVPRISKRNVAAAKRNIKAECPQNQLWDDGDHHVSNKKAEMFYDEAKGVTRIYTAEVLDKLTDPKLKEFIQETSETWTPESRTFKIERGYKIVEATGLAVLQYLSDFHLCVERGAEEAVRKQVEINDAQALDGA